MDLPTSTQKPHKSLQHALTHCDGGPFFISSKKQQQQQKTHQAFMFDGGSWKKINFVLSFFLSSLVPLAKNCLNLTHFLIRFSLHIKALEMLLYIHIPPIWIPALNFSSCHLVAFLRNCVCRMRKPPKGKPLLKALPYRGRNISRLFMTLQGCRRAQFQRCRAQQRTRPQPLGG